ncbi:MAG: RNA pyrophosphohydrolase [Beijerinckiaceae bacterium]
MSTSDAGRDPAFRRPDWDLYRPCVGIALFNHKGQVFVGRRRGLPPDDPFAWQMPQGGIDESEPPLQAALRELREETNVRTASLLAEAPDWYFYDLPPDSLKKSWRGKFKGQRQKWFAMRFDGDETEINIHTPDCGEKPEFSAWRWESLSYLPSLIVPFKQPVYRQVADIFAPFAA